MKRGGRIKHDPAKAQERALRRQERREAEGPRPEDIAREARRAAGERAHLASVTNVNVREVERERAKPTVQKRRRPLTEASREQRAAVANKACVVCRCGPCDPAHLLPLGVCADGDGDPRAVVPLCRKHHDEYDGTTGHAPSLDLLPWLEPHYRTELAFAVERFGLLSTLRRVTNDRYAAIRPGESVQNSANREREDET